MPVSGVGGTGGTGEGGGTLQDSYASGESIQVTTANGPFTIFNNTDATDTVTVNRTFAGDGHGIDVNMGTGGEAVTDNGLNIDMGSASTGAGISANLVAGAAGDGLQINDAGDGTSIFANKTSANGTVIDIQSSGTSVLTVSAAGDFTARGEVSASEFYELKLDASGGAQYRSVIGGAVTGADLTMESDATTAGATASNLVLKTTTTGGGTVGGVSISAANAVAATSPVSGQVLIEAVDVAGGGSLDITTNLTRLRSLSTTAASSGASSVESRNILSGDSGDVTILTSVDGVGTAGNVFIQSDAKINGTEGGISLEVHSGGAALAVPAAGQILLTTGSEVQIDAFNLDINTPSAAVSIEATQVLMEDGTAALPAWSFTTGGGTAGLSLPTIHEPVMSTNGVEKMRWTLSTIAFTNPLRGANGSGGSPTYAFTSGTNTGMWFGLVEAQLNFSTNGQTAYEMLKVLNNANGDEVSHHFHSEVSKLTSGNYVGLGVDVDETAGTGPAPGSTNFLMQLRSDTGGGMLPRLAVSPLGSIFARGSVGSTPTTPALSFGGAEDMGFYAVTASQMIWGVTGVARLSFSGGVTGPAVDNSMDLGTSGLKFKDLYTYRLKMDVGTAALPAITFDGETTDGIYWALNTVGTTIDGNSKFVVSATEIQWSGILRPFGDNAQDFGLSTRRIKDSFFVGTMLIEDITLDNTVTIDDTGITYGGSDNDFEINGTIALDDASGKNWRITGATGGAASASAGGTGATGTIRSGLGGAGTVGLAAGAGGDLNFFARNAGLDNGGGGADGGGFIATLGLGTGAGLDGQFNIIQVATAARPTLIFNGDINTGFYQQVPDQVAVATAGTVTMAWTNTEVQVNAHLRPNADSAYDLGLTATKWRDVYADTLQMDDGTTALPSHSFDSAPTGGMYATGANIGFATSGAERFLIGTTTCQFSVNILPKTAGVQNIGSSPFPFGNTFSQVFLAEAGTVGAPSVTFDGAEDKGFYSSGTDQIGLALGGINTWAVGPHTLANGSGVVDINTFTFTAAAQATAGDGWRALTVNMTSQGTGTGIRRLLDMQVAGVSQAYVTNSGRIIAADGTVGAPGHAFLSELDVGTFRVAANQLGLAANSEAVIVDNSTAQPTFRADVDDTWHLGTPVIRWERLFVGAGNIADVAVSVGAADIGIYRVGTNLLGLAVASEAVIVDNDAATPSFRPDVDSTWDLGETAVKWNDAHIDRVLLDDGGVGTPSLTFTGNTQTGLRRNGIELRVTIAGADRVVFSSTTMFPAVDNSITLGLIGSRFIRLNVADGTVALPSVAVGEATTGLLLPASNQLGLVANGETVIVDNDAATPSFRPDVTATWTLGEAAITWDVLYVDGGASRSAPSVSVGAVDVGLYLPGVNKLGLAANGEAIWVDNDGATPSFHGEIDTVWTLGEPAFRYARIFAGPGTAIAPAVTVAFGTTDDGNGIYAPATNQLAFAVNGAQELLITSAITTHNNNVHGAPDIGRDLGSVAIRWRNGFFGPGSVGTPSVSISNTGSTTTDNGFYAPADDEIGVTLNGVGEYIFKSTAFEPFADNVNSLGASGKRFSDVFATTTTIGDLRLHSLVDDAKYTINESRDGIFLHDMVTGKVYKFLTEEVDPATAPPPLKRDDDEVN